MDLEIAGSNPVIHPERKAIAEPALSMAPFGRHAIQGGFLPRGSLACPPRQAQGAEDKPRSSRLIVKALFKTRAEHVPPGRRSGISWRPH